MLCFSLFLSLYGENKPVENDYDDDMFNYATSLDGDVLINDVILISSWKRCNISHLVMKTRAIKVDAECPRLKFCHPQINIQATKSENEFFSRPMSSRIDNGLGGLITATTTTTTTIELNSNDNKITICVQLTHNPFPYWDIMLMQQCCSPWWW